VVGDDDDDDDDDHHHHRFLQPSHKKSTTHPAHELKHCSVRICKYDQCQFLKCYWSHHRFLQPVAHADDTAKEINHPHRPRTAALLSTHL